MRIMILTANDPDEVSGWEKEASKTKGVSIEIIYKPIDSVFLRIIRKIHRYVPLPKYEIWFGAWWKQLEHTDLIIAVAYNSTYRIFKMMKRKYPQIRKILYWWDPVKKTISPDQVSDSVCEKWTFHKQDADRYRIRYNPQFFARDLQLCTKYRNLPYQYDIAFFGAAGEAVYASRIKILSELDRVCKKMGIHVCFGLWYHNRIRKNRPFELKKYLNEEEYYKVLMQSKAILDITEPGNEWLTLRPVEALYLGKKLITNNRFIKEEKL